MYVYQFVKNELIDIKKSKILKFTLFPIKNNMSYLTSYNRSPYLYRF